ncbi:cytochrome oxidase maturation protein, cbb3-type [Cognatiyoonia koreensis]|uniref:Cytochrome oxidase maturation protein, cbb3-type n=1 Tax=Cognatiyoonia koreensis TaxID=364200 RepID=A0A1I0RNS5_9RHOB|nr:cbb3-type cytochrome oxidase assembly protein CcoS [Cognatiyoonia koreensis]SEW42993.1 cytochrome oxidase maturation protein, cbb3-type [Cognatiyoonia koreensis]
MNILVILIPASLILGGLGLAAFLWSLKANQYEDLSGDAWRILSEDDPDQGKRD